MTKKEFADSWKHFSSCIKWDRTFLDAEAIQFMNTGIGEVLKTFEQRDALLDACKKAKDYLDSSSKLDWDNIITPILEAAIALNKKGK